MRVRLRQSTWHSHSEIRRAGKGKRARRPEIWRARRFRSFARPTGDGWRSSPLLHPRPQVKLMRPGAARLAMEHPVVLGDRVGRQDTVLALQRGALGKILANPGSVDRAV